MIHAENGDMIEWLTGKFNAGGYMTELTWIQRNWRARGWLVSAF
jgi:hypothetical protein